MKLSNFATDLNLAKNGVRIEVGEGFAITICKAGESNENFQKVLRQLRKPYQNMKKISPELESDIFNKAIAEAIVVSWEGLKDDNDVEIPYSKDKCYEIMKDKQYEEFHSLVLKLATEQAVFAKESVDATKSNA